MRECVSEAKRWHNRFAKKVERRYDAWRGLLPENNQPKGWRSNQHPPYLINIVEGMLSSLEEPNPTWLVQPRPLPGMEIDEVMAATDGAEIATYLLGHQMRIDGFHDKGGPLAHQDLIAGLTVGKIYWLQKKMRRKSLDEVPTLIYDEAGGRSTSRTSWRSLRTSSRSATTRRLRYGTCATSCGPRARSRSKPRPG